jgi:ABC-type transport system substrate-binding protein
VRMVRLASLAVVVLASACGGSSSVGPTAPTPASANPPIPVASGDASGRIENPDTAADLITYNQSVNVGFSVPVEGLIQRSQSSITRWELPVPVYVDPSIKGNCVEEALTRASRCAPPARMN